ncbi:MAG: peptidylprolyl isomerase [Bacteroidetes bacterium]|nr:peptidylprolyl isomerase [Bacteroidota bacterium]MBS1972764.1 peptidylprolyl isomerase [Bacteroidota bacterium]
MKKIIFLFVLFFSVLFAFSQEKIVADKIVGIVGDKIVLKSDINSAISDITRQGGQAPDDCSILDGMMVQKALVLQAERDSIPVSDDDVEAEIDQKIRYFIAQYGSKDALEQIAGRTIYQLKEDFRQPIREQRMAQGMRNKVVQEVKITPSEVKEYYDRIPKDSLRFYESELQIGELIVYPKASHDIEKLAIDELSEYKRQVESGLRKFDVLAKLYSDDPGSRDKGGEYSISRSDKQWDPVFLAAAFRLKDGQISPVIKTQFGYHIIQMVSRNGDDALIRHILRIPQITDVEINAAVQKLDSIRGQLINGTIGFGEAVAKYSDDPNAKFTAGLKMARDGSTYLTIDQLDKEVVKLLNDLKVGEYSKPTPFTDQTGKKGVHIIELISKSDPHRENLKDDYNKIAQRALEEKKQAALEKWFRAKIPSYYIMVDNDYKHCPSMIKWESSITASK